MKKLNLLIVCLIATLSINAQSIFSPIPTRLRAQFKEQPNQLKSLKLQVDSSAYLWSLTASANAFAYQFGANSGGKLLNGAGIGVSYAQFNLRNSVVTPIWDVSALFMTSVKITNMSFTGAGGLVAVGFNPGYLMGIGGNYIIREGVAYVGTQGFTNMNFYLTTSVGINF
jgi:hypothetical protein